MKGQEMLSLRRFELEFHNHKQVSTCRTCEALRRAMVEASRSTASPYRGTTFTIDIPVDARLYQNALQPSQKPE